MTAAPLLRVEGISKRFGAVTALDIDIAGDGELALRIFDRNPAHRDIQRIEPAGHGEGDRAAHGISLSMRVTRMPSAPISLRRAMAE